MTATTATITIEVDGSEGVTFIVMGDPGRAMDIANEIMKYAIAIQRPENYLGTKEYTVS